MEKERIKVPQGIIRLNRPGFRGRLFTTPKIEQRQRNAKDERYTKRVLQCIQRQALIADPRLSIEIQKVESVEKLKDSLLQELAVGENTMLEVSENTEISGGQKWELLLDKKTHEIMQALKTLV